jgi:hypothetical protein
MTQPVYLPTPTQIGDTAVTGRAVPLPAVPSIEGNEFAVLTNGWEAMDPIADRIASRLKGAGARAVHIIARPRTGIGAARPEVDTFIDDVAAKVAGAVTGLGN